MRNNVIILILLLFTALLSMGFQKCNKEEIKSKYNFLEKLDLHPVQKIYQVGDTIWLEYINSSKMLFDKNTGQKILADNVGIQFQVSYNSRYSKNPVTSSGGLCDFISPVGININRYMGQTGNSALMNFGCNGANNYNFKVGVVLKQKGYYSLGLFDNQRSVFGCSNRIPAFPHSTIAYRFNLADCNKDIYFSIPKDQRMSDATAYPEREIDNKEVFVLKVE